mgnify:CR=1 FL=1
MLSIFYSLTFLQDSPELLWNCICIGAFHIEFAGTIYFHRIAIACYIVIYTERLQSVSIHLKCLLLIFDFYIFDRKRKLRRDHTQCIDNPFQPFWANQCQWFRPVCISHCKEKSR